MLELLFAPFQNPLVLNALFAGLLAAIPSGIIGSYVVIKRIVFISGSIAHSILGGIGLAIFLQRNYDIAWATPLLGALTFSILSALLIGWVHLAFKEREDTVIASIWSVGMAAGILFISVTPGFDVELSSFFVGNILWVGGQDLLLLGLLDLLVIALVALLHKRLLILCFDENQARLQGVHAKALYFLLLVLIAITVVLLIQVVGIVLVMALLTIPPALGNLLSPRLSAMMLYAVGISAFVTTSGILCSYHLDWPTGATIALFSGLTYLTFQTWKKRMPLEQARD